MSVRPRKKKTPPRSIVAGLWFSRLLRGVAAISIGSKIDVVCVDAVTCRTGDVRALAGRFRRAKSVGQPARALEQALGGREFRARFCTGKILIDQVRAD